MAVPGVEDRRAVPAHIVRLSLASVRVIKTSSSLAEIHAARFFTSSCARKRGAFSSTSLLKGVEYGSVPSRLGLARPPTGFVELPLRVIYFQDSKIDPYSRAVGNCVDAGEIANEEAPGVLAGCDDGLVAVPDTATELVGAQ